MQNFNLSAQNIFVLIILGMIAFALTLEPVKVVTLLIWVAVVAIVFAVVEGLVSRRKA